MNNAIELFLILSKLLSFPVGVSACLLLFAHIFLNDRLWKPFYVKLMRKVCSIASFLVIVLILLRAIQLIGLFFEFQTYRQPTFINLVIHWSSIIILGSFFFPYYRYFLKHPDDHLVIFNWLMDRFFKLSKKGQIEQAYDKLQKASEIKNNDIFVWSMMALINEKYFKNSESAETFLLKAEQTFSSKQQPTPQEESILESVKGEIALLRNSIHQSIEHFTKAYELDPKPFLKERLEELTAEP